MDYTKWKSVAVKKDKYDIIKALCDKKYRAPAAFIAKLVDEYIAFQASKGQLSHYNLSTPIYSALFSLMALAATLVTLYTAYVGFLFFTNSFPNLPDYYVWAIRLSIVIFVLFSFEGFAMGSRLNHSVGALNDNSNWFIVGWSKTVGDLRVSHFIGMHALQVLPILSFYILRNTKWRRR
jgi:hypothetical protein